jgi:hypothetical protein
MKCKLKGGGKIVWREQGGWGTHSGGIDVKEG